MEARKKSNVGALIVIVVLVAISVITIFLIRSKTGSIGKVEIDYGTSVIYTREDMEGAIKEIKNEFAKWEGCVLHTVDYIGDDYCNEEEQIQWMNELAKGQDISEEIIQCIAFRSSFHSPVFGVSKSTFNLNQEYTNWTWYLGRSVNGKWYLLTWGY